jgi:hypothetical protein
MSSCMFTCVISHLIGLQVGCSGTFVETLSLLMRRIPVLAVVWTLSGLLRVSYCAYEIDMELLSSLCTFVYGE